MKRLNSFLLISVMVILNASLPTYLYATSREVVVHVAYQGPLSGPESPLGQGELDAARYAISNFNAYYQGHIRVELKTFDDQGMPSVALTVAPLAAEDSNIIGLVGPAYSGASIASLPFYKERSLTMISPSASRGDMTNPYSPSFGAPVFHRVVAVDKQKGSRINSWAVEGVSNPRIFVVTDSSRPIDWLGTLAPIVNRVGVLNMNDYYGKQNMTIPIILNSNPNIVIIDSYEANTEFLKNLKSAGYLGKLIATDNWSYEPNVLSAATNLSGLQFVELTPNSLRDIDPRLESEYISKTNRASSLFALQTIDATNVLLNCIAGGVRTRSEMLECVKNFSGRSITGELFSFDKFGDITNPFLTLSSIFQGQIQRERFTLRTVIPELGNLESTKGGFQFEILNFESKGNYWMKTSAGSINQREGLISITGLEPGQVANVTVATSLQLLSLNSKTIMGKAGLTPEQIEKENKLAIEKILAEATAKAEAIRQAQKLADAKTEAEQKLAAAIALAEKMIAEAKSATGKKIVGKKSTITCVKGKLTKKVTASKPICPAGYKLKK